MIWDSIALMTVIDLTVLAGGLVIAVLIYKYRHFFSSSKSTYNLLIVSAGILVIAVFYGADLFTMWVLPGLVGKNEAMSAMERLHLNYSWIAITIGFAAITAGLAFHFRTVFHLIRKLEDNEQILVNKLNELEASETRYRNLVEDSQFGVRIERPGGERLVVNKICVEMFGFECAEEYLEAISEPGTMVAPYDRGWLLKNLEARKAGKNALNQYEYDALRKDGSIMPVEVFIRQIIWEGKPALLRTFFDISERRANAEALKKSMEQAEFANRAKSEFLANMSHELRTPLNAIIGFSETIRDQTFGPVGNPKYLEYVNDINLAGGHLLQIINDILDLSKIEASKVELHEEIVNVSEVIGSCVLLVKERAETGGIDLKLDLADGLPPLFVDMLKLKQILINLLSNSIKFTPAGGVVKLKVWSRPDSGYVIQIADTGIGIALEDIPIALTPFKQVDSNLSRKFDGTGLGLPLCKSFAEMHGGSLDLQSDVGVGTTVTVRIPAERIMSIEATAI